MARYGIVGAGRLGLSVPVMRRIARELGRDHALALALWDSGIPDAQIVASMVAQPALLTLRQMDAWVATLASWDVCDQACANAFAASPHAWHKVRVWSRRRREFTRRAAFALLASLAAHDRQAGDARFLAVLPLLESAAADERNSVSKAVSWALRGIGKRNAALNAAAVQAARRIAVQPGRAARWIASDVLRELTGDPVRQRLLRASAAGPRRRPAARRDAAAG